MDGLVRREGGAAGRPGEPRGLAPGTVRPFALTSDAMAAARRKPASRKQPPATRAAPAARTPTRGTGGVVVRFERFYRVVRRIPHGKVATYGQVAALAGMPRGARLAGYALSALRGTAHDVPWQRVLGARGAGKAGVSLKDPMGAAVQAELLQREGVVLDARGRIDLGRFGWRRGAAPRPARRSQARPARPRREGARA